MSTVQGGPDNADKPFVWLQLESINSYDDPEKVKSLTPLLYSFLESELKIEKVGQSRNARNAPLYYNITYMIEMVSVTP